jgi:Fur family transcriptional regulator, ferric uptake regulator
MQTAQEMIAGNGLKPTKARISILNIMLNSKKALSHHDILTALEGVKEIDRVTVYRVLEWLLEHGLIHKISGDDRAWKFQLNAPERSFKASNAGSQNRFLNNHSHAHLHCQSCHTVLCLDELEAKIPQEIFGEYRVSNVDLNLKGLCKDCQ